MPWSDIETVDFGSCQIDFSDGVIRGESEVSLTETESLILQRLIAEEGDVVSRDVIYRDVFEDEYTYEDRRLHSHVSRIRKKLKSCGLSKTWIKNEWGVGYFFSSG